MRGILIKPLGGKKFVQTEKKLWDCFVTEFTLSAEGPLAMTISFLSGSLFIVTKTTERGVKRGADPSLNISPSLILRRRGLRG